MGKAKKINGKKVDEVEEKQVVVVEQPKAEPVKKVTKPTKAQPKVEKPKAEQETRREAFFKKYEHQIREHFSKDGSKASELKKAMGLKTERDYLDLLWCRDKVLKAEKK
jgi:hypothetical protein